MSFSGSFRANDEVQFFNFMLAGGQTVRVETFSYAGGTQSDGKVVSAGGYDPILTLSNADSGAFPQSNDDGTDRIDLDTFSSSDSRLDVFLTPGSYAVAISQFGNFALGTSPTGSKTTGTGPSPRSSAARTESSAMSAQITARAISPLT